MLPKQKRLSRAEFSAFFPKTKRFHSEYMTAHYFPTVTASQWAVVAGKKVSKLAVVRNRVRRQVYAVLARQIIAHSTGVYIFVIKPTFVTVTKSKHEAIVARLLAQIEETR
jgi:ribonuclease P protein component